MTTTSSHQLQQQWNPKVGPPVKTYATEPFPHLIIINIHPSILPQLQWAPGSVPPPPPSSMEAEIRDNQWPGLKRKKHPGSSSTTHEPKTSSAHEMDVDMRRSQRSSGNTSTAATELGSAKSHSKKRRGGSPRQRAASVAKVSCHQQSAPDTVGPNTARTSSSQAPPQQLPQPNAVELRPAEAPAPPRLQQQRTVLALIPAATVELRAATTPAAAPAPPQLQQQRTVLAHIPAAPPKLLQRNKPNATPLAAIQGFVAGAIQALSPVKQPPLSEEPTTGKLYSKTPEKEKTQPASPTQIHPCSNGAASSSKKAQCHAMVPLPQSPISANPAVEVVVEPLSQPLTQELTLPATQES
ncbi:hypothetical protein Pelo_18895 [Pelomyxa schiedti]|nr:hypothetical protein Pelo_18895 [Pelomyxa schiedti]